MKKYYFNQIKDLQELCQRPGIIDVSQDVRPILDSVSREGDTAILDFTKKFDCVKLEAIEISTKNAGKELSSELKSSFQMAAENIRKFHKAQKQDKITVETMPGVICSRETRAIENVGLYIPGGTAPLPSTVLMLAIPAKLAGCKEIILCSPPPIAEVTLYAAKLCGIDRIFQIGGAQAIAAMAYGTESVPKVNKIFGPGNQYVTAAKMMAQAEGVAIDMPAGPSEVLVIADGKAQANFVAADLLSQAEHGPDSQVVLVCTDEKKADEVLKEIQLQIKVLPRKDIIQQALKNSFMLICEGLEEALEFSNIYAPEHLILNIDKADDYLDKIENAGSVFVGPYSCESAGDYASGTNHTLPTYGYAKSYSGVSLDSFVKKITFQKLTKEGVRNIGPIVENMAEAEQLQAHKNAITIRL